jgi:hypothetical protein
VPTYLCRWPNGDCSVVSARNKDDAISALDEVGSARPEWLRPIDHFVVHFQLTDEGELGLEAFGEKTVDDISDAYPALVDTMRRFQEGEATAAELKVAVQIERERVKDPDAESEVVIN